MLKSILTTCALLLPLTAATGDISMAKRHQLCLRVGMWNQTTDSRIVTEEQGITTSVGANGVLGGLAYGNWLQENLALTFAINGMALDVKTGTGASGVISKTSAVSSMLMGVKYYFVNSSLTRAVRPYAKGSAGPFIGSQSSETVGTSVVVESRTEFAFGGQIGAGLDFITGRNFMMGIGGAYNVMSDFGNEIGGSKNFSGPEFAFEFSWLFGKGVTR